MISTQAVHRILDTWPVGVLSTFGPDDIDSVPVVFARVGDRLYSPIDGKPKRGTELQRIRNLERDDRYTLLLQHYDDDWRGLWWLKIAGTATVRATSELDHDLLVDLSQRLASKYPQYQTVDMFAGGRVLELAIQASNAWAFRGDDWLARQFS